MEKSIAAVKEAKCRNRSCLKQGQSPPENRATSADLNTHAAKNCRYFILSH
jgi:hypothetical protein